MPLSVFGGQLWRLIVILRTKTLNNWYLGINILLKTVLWAKLADCLRREPSLPPLLEIQDPWSALGTMPLRARRGKVLPHWYLGSDLAITW